ncbi:Ig-like domain-containing protein [Methanobrevibacter oralis]|uniref:Ig-like domain-containing protein n=1 Tax=Methanobrevibacter oralis TaxID=66851 RepID=UPI0005B2730E|nr:Ig-like domain-containing protein [Methanobrevibacter oralis]
MNVIGDFIGNVAGHYGAIYIERCNLSIKGNFIRNNVTWNGGVGYISKTNATMIGDFINNTAGMMFSLFINEIGSNTTIIGNFMNNTAERFGIANKGYINVKGNFTNNIADYGGALFNAGNCSIVGNFTNNIADYGGALFNAGNCSIVGNFTNNIADYGGALYNSGNMVIQGDFINNTAFKYGGALYNSGNMVIQGDFINNTANEYGGAIFVDGNLNCSYGIFYRNFANNTNSTVFIYSGNVDLSYNFWGCNNPNFTDLINSSNNYTMDNFFQVLLKCDVMNSTLTIGDELHYYVDLKLNTSGPFDLGKLSPINVNLRDNVNAILDEFIVQNNTAPNSRNTTVNNNLNYYNLYFYDNLLDVLIYKTKIRSLVSVNVENGFYNTTLEANITLCDVNGNNLTDDVIVTINGVNYTVNVVNGHAYFNISGLDSGNYSVAVIYNGNGNI